MAQTEAFPIGFTTSRWDRKRIGRDRNAIDGPCVSMGLFETWRKRVRFRGHLWRLLRDKPELIEDVGLSIEIAQQESGQAVLAEIGPRTANLFCRSTAASAILERVTDRVART